MDGEEIARNLNEPDADCELAAQRAERIALLAVFMPECVAAVAMAGYVSWYCADSTRARAFTVRALAIDPEYELAKLAFQALLVGLPSPLQE